MFGRINYPYDDMRHEKMRNKFMRMHLQRNAWRSRSWLPRRMGIPCMNHPPGHSCDAAMAGMCFLFALYSTVFLVGVYAGIFADQHYKIPRVDNPSEILAKAKEFAEKYKKGDTSPPKSD